MPTEKQDCLPTFPRTKVDGRYEVHLPCEDDTRPSENQVAAAAKADKLAARFESKGKEEEYEAVLPKEYQELDAIEQEPRPEEPRYYMSHHAVFWQEASATKTRKKTDTDAVQALLARKNININNIRVDVAMSKEEVERRGVNARIVVVVYADNFKFYTVYN